MIQTDCEVKMTKKCNRVNSGGGGGGGGGMTVIYL